MRTHAGLRLTNDATPLGGDWWAWSVWVDGPPTALDDIASVRYTLHSTFKDPVRVVTDRPSNFKLASKGWGEFTVYAQITTHSGETISLERWLEFGPGATDATSGRKPAVFVSSGAVDRPLLTRIRQLLATQGVDVLSDDEAQVGSTWSDTFRDILPRTDLVAFIVSGGGLRGFAREQLEMALERQLPVVPIVVGTADVPAELASFQAIRTEGDEHASGVADALAARAKDLVYQE